MATHRRHWRSGRGAGRGMTLVEIMIVVIVMALIATGVAYAVIPMLVDARRTETQTDVRTIQNAVSLYMVQHGACPGSIDELTLSSTTRHVDVWGNDFVIECDLEAEPVVISSGEDGQQGTDDDIRSSAQHGDEEREGSREEARLDG